MDKLVGDEDIEIELLESPPQQDNRSLFIDEQV